MVIFLYIGISLLNGWLYIGIMSCLVEIVNGGLSKFNGKLRIKWAFLIIILGPISFMGLYARLLKNIRAAWDEAEEINCSIRELTDRELVECRDALFERSLKIMGYLDEYVPDQGEE